MSSSKGYTLIELLITLTILSFILLIPIIKLSNPSSNDHEADLIAKQIKEQILLAQHVAIANGRRVFIRMNNDTKEFSIRYNSFDDYLVIPYQHSDMLFESQTLSLSSVYFHTNGHPGTSGTFQLRIGQNRYRYTIYLGKGMVSYTKM
ncbi:competence type IV pilus minor pilin ComGD [Halalkalibacter flavus]|jgi:competence protein ComGD|uniref:competence type IV pilus minor pilin ComGD n=1 Tax=Halalkalibacter flavus TaxID=3090668 RepID=UPI002FCA201F